MHPTSPESTEAQRLVQLDYLRLYPLLKQAEGLLVQRVELYDKDQLVDLCVKKSSTSPEGCEAQVVGARHLPTVHFLDGVFQSKLDEIRDAVFTKALKGRYARAEGVGEYDPEVWAKPPGIK